MSFASPWYLLSLVSIPIIIIMYLLKQKFKERQVPSLFLWRLASDLTEAQRPWQKLKRSLLLLLQIIAAFLISIALASPYFTANQAAQSYVLVLDASMSMQATDVSPSRFDSAKQQIAEFVSSVKSGSSVALVLASETPLIVSNFSDDKSALLRKLEPLTVTSTGVNKDAVNSLVSVLTQQQPGTVYVFSDSDIVDGNKIIIGKNSPNTAITSISHIVESDRLVVLVKLKNYGERKSVQLALYTDEKLYDVRDVELERDGSKDVFFTSVPNDCQRLTAKLTNSDFLVADDVRYEAVSQKEKRSAALVTNGNVFLENILTLMPGIELKKIQPGDADSLKGFYLYIFDGVAPPDELDGHVLVFNPPRNDSVSITNVFQTSDKFFNFLADMRFSILRSKAIEMPPGFETVMNSPETPLIIAGDTNGKKTMVVGFDLHDTDLPIKKEFPVFIYNIISWFVPSGVTVTSENLAGRTVEINADPSAAEINIVDPQMKLTKLKLPMTSYGNTDTPGFYSVSQKSGSDTLYSQFAVNVNTDKSDLRIPENLSDAQEKSESIVRNKSLRNTIIVAALILLALEWWVFTKRFKSRAAYIAMRAGVVTALVIAMFGINIKAFTENTTTIIALDMSKSMDVDKALDFVYAAEKSRKPGDLVGLLAYGENAVMDAFPQVSPLKKISSIVKGNFTNLENALTLAQSIIPEDTKKRVMIVSDGRENAGDSFSLIKQLTARGIVADVYLLENELKAEVQINELRVPKQVKLNSKYDIDVMSFALSPTSGKLKIYKNNRLIVNQDVNFRKGENTFAFTDTAEESGGALYRAEIEPLEDTYSENNRAYAHSQVTGVTQVLILDYKSSGDELRKILSSVEITQMPAMSAPSSAEQLAMYDTVVLVDVPLDYMPDELPASLQSYVKDAGGGVVVIGGENSYALGGYSKTPLEELLPVDMELKDKSKTPDMGMVIVLDRSGSMGMGEYGVSKLGLAKEAVFRSLDTLNDKDKFGVLAFDDGYFWASGYKQVGGNKSKTQDEIGGITLGGGTSILPGLNEAYKTLLYADAKIKHIILLTDGQAEHSGYTGLVDSMNAAGITLSTVAVGSDADLTLLKWLAEAGHGRYYMTNEFTDLPKIFATETRIAGRNFINNDIFYPKLESPSMILSGISEIAQVKGYISTTAKPRGDMILLTPKDEPLLASWQYGLGRVVAWTSDATGVWSGDWINSDSGVDIFRNMVSFSARRQMEGEISLTAESLGENTKITVTVPFDEGIDRVSASIVSENEAFSQILSATAPGSYSAVIDNLGAGSGLAHISINRGDETTAFVTGFSTNYSPEFDARERDNSGILQLAASTGGKVLTDPSDAYYDLPKLSNKQLDLTPYFLLLALLLFLIDIALRRFPWLIPRFSLVNFRPNIKNTKENVEDISSISVVKSESKIQPIEIEKKDNLNALLSQKKKRK